MLAGHGRRMPLPFKQFLTFGEFLKLVHARTQRNVSSRSRRSREVDKNIVLAKTPSFSSVSDKNKSTLKRVRIEASDRDRPLEKKIGSQDL